MDYDFDDLILTQLNVFNKIKSANDNYSKKSDKNQGGIEARLAQLEIWWAQYQDNDKKFKFKN